MRNESEYQKAMAHLSSLFPTQLPIETQAAWRIELRDEGIDPRDAAEAVRQLGRHVEGRIYLRKLFDACKEAREARQRREAEEEASKRPSLAPRARHDPLWNEAGMRLVKRTLAGEKFTEEEFQRAHREEYDRLCAEEPTALMEKPRTK